MKTKNLFFTLFVTLFFAMNVSAQNKPKHIGCWKIVKMEIAYESEQTNKAENEAKNTIICLFEDGTFTNQNPNKDIPVLKGFYSVSADGKIFSQRRDVDAEEDAMPMDILLLNDKEFIVETEGIAKMTLQKIE
jgi:hypothetical protein